jgi:hypothetical protein
MSGAAAPRHAGYFMKSTVSPAVKIAKDFPSVKDLHQISCESFVIMARA